MHIFPKFIRDWIDPPPPPEPSKLETLSLQHDKLWKELQNAKAESAKWKHSLNLYQEEYQRIAQEIKEHVEHVEQPQGDI